MTWWRHLLFTSFILLYILDNINLQNKHIHLLGFMPGTLGTNKHNRVLKSLVNNFLWDRDEDHHFIYFLTNTVLLLRSMDISSDQYSIHLFIYIKTNLCTSLIHCEKCSLLRCIGYFYYFSCIIVFKIYLENAQE